MEEHSWKHYPTKRLRGEEFKLIGLVSLIPSLQAAQGHPRKLDAGKLHVQFERRTEVSAKVTERASSDPTAMRPTNIAARSAAETAERRAGAKGNAGQQSTGRAQDRESVSQALERVRQTARRNKAISASIA
jgi:hypothetical protein